MTTVRSATATDVPALLPMVRALCTMHQAWDPERFDYLPNVVDRYALWLPQRAADPRSVFLVASSDPSGRPIGFLIGTIMDNIPIYITREFGFIHDMWVDPEFRARGVGRALVRSAIDRFAALGVRQVRLETAALNDAARSLFSACGFRVSAQEMIAAVEPA